MLGHPFIRHALLAGTGVAVVSGLVGHYLVLRAQVFAADALSHVALTGALGALAFGIDLRLGLFVVTVGVALAMGVLDGRRADPDEVVIGGVLAWTLGLGALFLTLYASGRSATGETGGTSVLFGSILGLSAGQAVAATVVAVAASLVVLAVARPLLFASVDGDVARARGVPTRALGVVFLAATAAAVAEATQVVGALLVLGLLAAPAGAASRLTARPYRALALSVLIAVLSVWVGVSASYLLPKAPPSFTIVATATVIYLVAGMAGPARRLAQA
ncbi:MAG: metal ABC transporter permease [Actinobacteria bacterium]|nr:metal ABC transporter permease [Actinomycetota bacterium]